MTGSQRIAYLLGSLVAFVMGGTMLSYYLSGLLEVYLDENFRDHCLIAGAGLIIVGAFNLLTLGRKSASCCGDGQEHGEDLCGHGHEECEASEESHHAGNDHHHDHHHHAFFGGESMGSTVVATLLICGTVGYAALLSPHEFSPSAIMNKGLYRNNYEVARPDKSLARGVNERQAEGADEAAAESGATATTTADIGAFSLADLEAQIDRDELGYFELEVPELYYTSGDLEVRRVLEGQPVVTVAQVMPEKFNNPEGSRVRIFRIFIECCAADARPLAIPVEFGKSPPEFQEMGWVQVRGSMTYRMEGGATVPVLLAEEMIETEEPDQTMMY